MGRSALIMVIGFTVVLLMIGGNISKVSSSAMENYMKYYKTEIAHSLAGSCINLAGRSLYENGLWTGGFSNKSFAGGVLNCTVVNVGGNQVRLTAKAKFMDLENQITCLVQPSSFSRYAYYTTTDASGYWVTGDTCWGPLHVNNWLNVAGKPVFMGRATTLNGLHRYTNPQNNTNTLDKPVFKGGFDSGINVSLPTNFNTLKTAAGSGGRKITGGQDVYMELQGNGKVKWKQGNNWTGGPWNNDWLNDFAGNGAFYAEGVNIHIKGELKGQLTVGCGGVTASTTQGNIWLDDDITYHKDPRIHPESTDMLGLVAENKLWIADNANNAGPGNDFILMASVFSRTDGLWVQNYGSGAVRGRLTTVGSQVAQIGGYTGVFSGDPPTVIHGYAPGGAYYDNRFMVAAPPYFPTTGQYEIISWLE
jgi:hypothetical protein